MKKNKVVVHLMGHDYTLLTDQSPEQVQRVARYVDRKLRETAITTRAAEPMVATLTSMTLADELFRAQDENVRLKRELLLLQSGAQKEQG
ncbi:MAG: cell division protein ZapA [Candidatus Ventricola sp.]